jgi:spore maturation protein CgeB
VQLHSWNWHAVFGRSDARQLDVQPPIWEAEYARAISESSATLCFFSTQNNDELTSRVFEIPACGGLLLSWRTQRLTEVFEDRKEAFFFSNIPELLQVARTLAESPELVAETKQRGMRRLVTSRYSVVDRCEDALAVFRGL